MSFEAMYYQNSDVGALLLQPSAHLLRRPTIREVGTSESNASETCPTKLSIRLRHVLGKVWEDLNRQPVRRRSGQ